MGALIELKDKLIRKLSTSLLLNFLDGYKTIVARMWQGLNAIVTGVLILVAVYDELTGGQLGKALAIYHAHWYLLGSWLASNLKLELGLNDQAAKERELEADPSIQPEAESPPGQQQRPSRALASGP